ncbi:transcription factor Ouib [Drosophila tropicalis]|uniref:transcription factor Ouib n=1 Tax=Drosophila tropicalis TaxID=46794 RepID=UPI0035ABF849
MPEYVLCRICLTEDINSDTMTPLFDDQDDGQCCELRRKIEEVSSIKLAPLDIPSMLCYSCVDRLTHAFKFRELCQASERTFASNVVKSEMKLEPTDENNIGHHHQIEYIYETTNEFIETDGDIEFLEEPLDEVEGTEGRPTATGEGSEIEHIIGDALAEDEGLAHHDDELLVMAHGSDSDYDPVENLRKSRLRVRRPKRLISKRGRGRPRSCHAPIEKTSHTGSTVAGKVPEETSTNIMCEICGNIYSRRAALNIHMRRHMAEKPFECEICSKTFAGPSELNRHIRVHTGEKPFTCKYCSRSFADRSSNIRHERTHTNERPFTCSTCGKSFSYSNVLKNHMLTHTGEKPFSCIPCNKTFSRKHQLEQHVGTMTHQQTVRSHQTNPTEMLY